MMQMEYITAQSSTRFNFYMLPAALFEEPLAGLISCEAKVLYSIILARTGLSKEHGWIDADGYVYIYLPLEEACRRIGCKKEKGCRLFDELIRTGLIERRKQGRGKPAKLYVKDFTTALDTSDRADNTAHPADENTDKPAQNKTSENQKSKRAAVVKTSENQKSGKEGSAKTSENRQSRLPKTGSQDFRKTDLNQIDRIKDNEYIESVYPSDQLDEKDGQTDAARLRKDFILAAKRMLQDTIQAYEFDLTSGKEHIRISGIDQPLRDVLRVLQEVDDQDIDVLYGNICTLGNPVRNMQSYIIAALYRMRRYRGLKKLHPSGRRTERRTYTQNRFNNFEQRDIDFDEMEALVFGR